MIKTIDIINKSKDKELIVYKDVFKFCESALHYSNYSFSYKHAKGLVYNHIKPNDELDYLIINVYNAYLFILKNANNVNDDIINEFLNMLSIDNDDYIYDLIKDIKLNDNYIDNLLNVYFNILNHYQDTALKEIISLSIFNMLLIRIKVVPIKFNYNNIIRFKDIVSIYNDDQDKCIDLLYELIINNKMQSKDYYNNLTDFTKDDIINYLRDNKDIINNKYKIKEISLFGSFANDTNRIDSDIDLILSFYEDITYDDKLRYVNEFKELMFNRFKRFVDISEDFCFYLNNSDDNVIKVFI